MNGVSGLSVQFGLVSDRPVHFSRAMAGGRVKSGEHGLAAAAQDVEKVLFASIDVQALGIALEADDNGCAAVIKSMVSPLKVDVALAPGVLGASDLKRRKHSLQADLEVGDVLFAVNGELVHRLPHEQVLAKLGAVDFFGGDSVQGSGGQVNMLVLSFKDTSVYYRQAAQGSLRTFSLTDPLLFGKLGRPSGWKDYIPGWSYLSGPKKSGSGEQQEHYNDITIEDAKPKVTTPPPSPRAAASLSSQKKEVGAEHGKAYLAFNAGDFFPALSIWSNMLKREPLNHTVRISRSMCYLRVGDPESALADALTCCALKPEWPMPYVCQGAALSAMGRPREACSAYVCGLVVDPSNAVIRQRLNELFAHNRYRCLPLNGKSVVGSVASAAMQREEWGADLLVDRLVLYVDSETCLSQLSAKEEGEEVVSLRQGGTHGSVSICIPNPGAYDDLVERGSALCQLFDGDEVLTLNSNPVKSLESFERSVRETAGVVVVGILSGARIAATQLLEKEVFQKAEAALSQPGTATLFTVKVSGCGTSIADGVYVPQELRNAQYVYENKEGCLLSFEVLEEDGEEEDDEDAGAGRAPSLCGWVIGHAGHVLYSGLLQQQVEDGHNSKQSKEKALVSKSKTFSQSSTSSANTVLYTCDEFLKTVGQGAVKWRSCGAGKAPLPSFSSCGQVPSLGFFFGDEGDERVDLHEWGADLQVLAIKGYATRSLNRGDLDTALECYNLVESQLETLVEDTESDNTDNESDATLDEDLSHILSSSSTSPRAAAAESSSSTKQLRHNDDDRDALRHLLASVLVNKSKALIDIGDADTALDDTVRACNAAAQSDAGPSAIALYYRALAQFSLQKYAPGIESCEKALFALERIEDDCSLKHNIKGLKEECVAQMTKQKQEEEEAKTRSRKQQEEEEARNAYALDKQKEEKKEQGKQQQQQQQQKSTMLLHITEEKPDLVWYKAEEKSLTNVHRERLKKGVRVKRGVFGKKGELKEKCLCTSSSGKVLLKSISKVRAAIAMGKPQCIDSSNYLGLVLGELSPDEKQQQQQQQGKTNFLLSDMADCLPQIAVEVLDDKNCMTILVSDSKTPILLFFKSEKERGDFAEMIELNCK